MPDEIELDDQDEAALDQVWEQERWREPFGPDPEPKEQPPKD